MGAKLPTPKPPPGAAQPSSRTQPNPGAKLPPPRPPKGAAARSVAPSALSIEKAELMQRAQELTQEPANPPEPGAPDTGGRGLQGRAWLAVPMSDDYPDHPDYPHPGEVRVHPPATFLPRTKQLLRVIHEELTMGTLDLAGHPSGRYIRRLIDHVDTLLHFPEATPPEAAPPEATPPEATPPEVAPPKAAPPEAAPPKAAPKEVVA